MKTILRIFYISTISFLCSCNPNPDNNTIKETDSIVQIKPETVSKNIDTSINSKNCDNIQIFPENNSYLDSTIVSFNRQLVNIIDKKDINALIKILDKDIITSNGGGISGIPDFYTNWDLRKDPKKSQLWSALNNVVKLGGCYNTDEKNLTFIFPYLQSGHLFKGCTFDWFSTCVCTKPKVFVYEKPIVNSRILDTLNYNVLETGYEASISGTFVAVKTFDGKISGYTLLDNVYFTADYALIVEKKNGLWKITSFAPFD